MKRILTAILLNTLILMSMTAQDILSEMTDREVPPPPVVSALTASVEESSIHLEWIQAPGVAGESIVLRSVRPITAANFLEAEVVGTVPYDINSFTDKNANGKDYYYAVMSRDADGTTYEFFLPASNALIVAVSTGISEPASDFAGIQAFAAIARNDTAALSWYSGRRGKSLVLYRSTSPFTSLSSLLEAVVVASFVDSAGTYTDYPVPGVPNFYALLDEDEIRTGTAVITPGVNTNLIPVQLSVSTGKTLAMSLPALRPMPLPLLNPSESPETTKIRFSSATEQKITILSKRTENEDIDRSLYVFSSDLEPAASGEEYSLRLVIDGSFRNREWKTAAKELTTFLSIRRSALSAAKAHFYLGQVEYFSGNYRDALLEFLLSRDQFENQSREWIQYSLQALVK